MAKTFYIIDSNSYAYRAFYAIPSLTAADGSEVNAVFGFYKMVEKILSEKKPDYIALAFDSPEPTFRHEMYPDYKTKRETMPESLQKQMRIIKEIAAAGGITCLEQGGYEADDIIASSALSFSRRKNSEVTILSGDKDMIQVIGPRVRMMKFSKKGEVILTPETVEKEYGIKPEMITDVLSLMGDASDNIPGVRGIGEKTAYKLVREYGSVKELLANAESIKPERAKKLIKAGIDDIKMSKKLAELKINRKLLKEIGFSEKNCLSSLINKEGLDRMFIKYNFKSLVFSREAVKKSAAKPGKAKALNSGSEAPKEVLSAPVISVFFAGETAPEIILAGGKKNYYYLPYPDREIPDKIKSKRIITNSAKILFSGGKSPEGKTDDISLMAYLLGPGKNYGDFTQIFTEYIGENFLSFTDVAGKGAKKIMFSMSDSGKIDRFVSGALYSSEKLADKLGSKIENQGLAGIYRDIELPLAGVLSKMEKTGIKVDVAGLEKFREKVSGDIKKTEESIFTESGGVFNINSPKQLSAVLFEKLGLPTKRKIKTGYSTDNEVLKSLEPMHPVVSYILKHRALVKLKTGFLDVLRGFAGKTGMVHPSYNQAVTATGRLSASNPNVQNIPVKEKEGKEIRKLFLPLNKGDRILRADYSQIELRILAHLSDDSGLKQAFLEDTDIHTKTASEIFEKDFNNVTHAERRAAKTINFGIVYGMSPYGLAKELGISNPEAAEYIDRFFATFAGVKKYQDETIAGAVKNGYVKTLSGRKRFIKNINSKNRTVREFAERAAINAPVQGSAADMIKIAMVDIDRHLEKTGMESKMIMQVHDELVFSVPAGELKSLEKAVKEFMENALRLSVPVKVKAGSGGNWYECG